MNQCQIQARHVRETRKDSDRESYSGMRDCIERLERKGKIIIEKVPVNKYVKMIRLKKNE